MSLEDRREIYLKHAPTTQKKLWYLNKYQLYFKEEDGSVRLVGIQLYRLTDGKWGETVTGSYGTEEVYY